MKSFKVLISAYACEPDKGSEPGIGWNIVRQMARFHEVWVITRSNNQATIETALRHTPIPSLHFIYYDLPGWLRWWKRGGRGIQLYYYLWQLGMYFVARNAHQRIDFDLAHHVTFVKYWVPSTLALLPIPLIWGPIGGGESTPPSFRKSLTWRGRGYEFLRQLMRRVGECDPFVRYAARTSGLSLATTMDTAMRLKNLGAKRIEILSQCGMDSSEMSSNIDRSNASKEKFCFLSTGRLLHWKGFHLGLEAFAMANLPNAEYYIVGEGPEYSQLRRLAQKLGVEASVKFLGFLARPRALEMMRTADVLVHPSMHDSGGWVCLEAMAMGLPVICLDLGGPAMHVTSETGVKVVARTPDQAISDMADSMVMFVNDTERRKALGDASRDRIIKEYSWEQKGKILNAMYHDVLFNPSLNNSVTVGPIDQHSIRAV